jgi:glycosyltransferase involved in cell wall biosynthesis
LTSDIPENKEVVEGAGFTFRRGDEEDLTRMLDLLVRNPALRQQMAAKAASRIQEHYLWPGIAQSIESAYYTLLGWHRAPVAPPGVKRRSQAA